MQLPPAWYRCSCGHQNSCGDGASPASTQKDISGADTFMAAQIRSVALCADTDQGSVAVIFGHPTQPLVRLSDQQPSPIDLADSGVT